MSTDKLPSAMDMAYRQWHGFAEAEGMTPDRAGQVWERDIWPRLQQGERPGVVISEVRDRLRGELQRRRARRIEPSAGLDTRGKIVAGRVPRRDDVPDGQELLSEYMAGQVEDPPISYQDLATKYQCSGSLIERRIKSVMTPAARVRGAQHEEDGSERPKTRSDAALRKEMAITSKIVEAFVKLRENCGTDAVRRAHGTLALHGLDRPKDDS